LTLAAGVGGLLYGLGGYGLPFHTIGILQLINVPIFWWFVQPVESKFRKEPTFKLVYFIFKQLILFIV